MENNRMQEADRLFSTVRKPLYPFQFDKKVAEVFPDMIKRSVPGYENIIDMIGLFAHRFARANSNCYDLGSSLGAVALAMRRNIRVEGCTIYAVDNSREMLERCRQNIISDTSSSRVECVLANIEDVEIDDASVVVLNFTLQFLPPQNRQRLMNRIFDGLSPGGICILSEKVYFKTDVQQQKFMTELHEDFKRMMGYSDLEISQKRQSLENVLIPNSREEIERMFEAAGFEHSLPWFQHLNFCSFFARK